MAGLRVPLAWADEYCRAADPGLFAPCAAELAEVILSHGQRARWLAEYSTDEIEQDLAGGMLVERLAGDQGWYYRLTGARLDVFAQPRTGRDTGVPQAYVTSVKPARGLGRTESLRPGLVRLTPVWDEGYCDLAELHRVFADGLRIAQRRRSLRDQARLGLVSTGYAPRPRRDLHTRVRRRYQPLLQMLELLEQRSLLEGEIRASGVVLGEAQLEEQPVLWLRLDERAAFVEGRAVKVHGAGLRETNVRIRAVEFDGADPLLAVGEPRAEVPPGSRLRLAQQGRFAMGRHSAALRQFLDERVEGNWQHLAMLMCAPQRLPVVALPPLPTYFDDRLNEEQRVAVAGAVNSPHVFHVQGPPGTGKTTVITEVVRQLVARGERVLLLAPMHVAVDEVLGRVAEQPGVLALRVSWDQSRVAPHLRRYLPEQVTRTYLRQARRPAGSQADRWRAEIARLRQRYDAIEDLRAAVARHGEATEQARRADAARAEWRRRLRAELTRARSECGQAEEALRRLDTALPPLTAHVEGLRAQLRAVPLGRRIWAWIQDLAGVTSEVARLSAAYQRGEAERRRLADQHQAWTARHATLRGRIASLEAEHVPGERHHQAVLDGWLVAAETARGDVDAARARLRDRTGAEVADSGEAELAAWRDRTRAEIVRREHRIALEQRWFELSGLAGGSAEALAEQVDRDLRRSANLICCTTTGVTRNLGDADFDTLIVDEASRVVDSEFLIGAVRARRWVLVGDEHQLPPYVEPSDEHHLHALSALHMVERGASAGLPAAVGHLAQRWAEDEELHQFRADTVLETANRLRDGGAWQRHYRGTYETAWRRLRELGGDADQRLLSAMLDHLVRSLFEESVRAVPPALRQRLVVQRRMIEPIAALVAGPVYGGDYRTPEEPEVTPLRYGGTNTPVVLVDTSIYGSRAAARQVGSGFVNDLEAELVDRMCRSWEARLLRSGGERTTVSVLTFYRRQATEIRARLGAPGFPDFRCLRFKVVDAVDRIQGQESDLVFLSFGRAYLGRGRPSARYGRWLQDVRRLNVACTRARRALVLVGHAPTLRQLNGVPAAEEFYRHLFTLLAERSDMAIAKGAR
ncbi:DEAD/DEAH box helicase [Micromonospora sp. NPDC048830]|uniref:DEAD/DEAH box helicase n=1 Tax=Micromonospora sp. NPDC048830 TaxID=3364257 RepID=UPI003712C30B